jgi:hypothetical protein
METELRALSKFLSGTDLCLAMQNHKWIIPTVQTVHIVAIALLFSSAVIVDLRLWRLAERDVPLQAVISRFFPVVWIGLVALLASGALMVIGEPPRALLNETFYLKMALLLLAVTLTAALHWTVSRDPAFWEATRRGRMAGRAGAGLSIVLWSAVLFAGRWIAYSQNG